MLISDEIAAVKRVEGRGILDPAREQELLDRLSRLAPAEMSDDVRALYETILRLSRDRQ